ncbi:MAG: glutamate ligase domain-containing protein [Anaerolineae bacterium]
MSQLLSPFSSLVRPLTVGPRPITPAGGALKRLLAHSQAPVIGIAGTGHPDLTMDLMSAMLRACGIRTTVGLGPALGQLDSLRAEDRVLVEVSGGLLRSPARGLAMLVLGGFAADELAPDQAPWELGDALTRLAAGVDGCVVVNADDARLLALVAQAGVDPVRASSVGRSADAFLRGSELIIVDPQLGVERRLCRTDQVPLGGPAFQMNMLLAACSAAIAGANVEGIRATLGAYEPGLDRLQRVATRQRVRWVSDGLATRPGQAAGTLRQFASDRVILIAGGQHGGQPLDRWREAVRRHADTVLLFGTAGALLADSLKDGGPLIVRCADLDDAVATAHNLAQPGNTVLFSPGCEPDDLLAPPPGESFRRLLLATGPHPRQEAA